MNLQNPTNGSKLPTRDFANPPNRCMQFRNPKLQKMNLREIIADYSNLNEDLVVYAKKDNSKFLNSSEAILLDLTEEEKEMKVYEIEKAKCPGFTYFLEMFLIKELMEDLENSDTRKTLEEKIDHVIYYAEYDA